MDRFIVRIDDARRDSAFTVHCWFGAVDDLQIFPVDLAAL